MKENTKPQMVDSQTDTQPSARPLATPILMRAEVKPSWVLSLVGTDLSIVHLHISLIQHLQSVKESSTNLINGVLLFIQLVIQ